MKTRRSSSEEQGFHSSHVAGSTPAAATVFATLLFACVLVAGCKSTGFVGISPVERPATAPSAKPAVEAVGAAVGPVETSNAELASKVSSLRREAAAWRTEAAAATARAKSLAEKGAATKGDLDQAWQDLQAAEARNLFLEKELEESDGLIARQSREIVDLRKSVQDAHASTVAKEMECESLASALREANERIGQAGHAAAEERERADKERKRAEVYRADAKANGQWKWTMILVAVGVGLLWLAREVIPRLVRPPLIS